MNGITDQPAAVVGLDAGHPLDRELHAHLVRPGQLHDDGRLHPLAHDQLAGHALALDGLDLVLAAPGLEMLVDDLVGGLGLHRGAREAGHEQPRESLADHESSYDVSL